jgi:hypothetical protein
MNWSLASEEVEVYVDDGVYEGLIVGDNVLVKEFDGVIVAVVDWVEVVVRVLLGEALGVDEEVGVREGVVVVVIYNKPVIGYNIIISQHQIKYIKANIKYKKCKKNESSKTSNEYS